MALALTACGLGDRARSRKEVLGGTTISTPGGQGALDRAQRVKIIHQGRDRHLIDLGVLANLVSAVDAEG